MEALAGWGAAASTPQLVLAATLVAVLGLIALRIVQNSLLSGRPPVLEGVPFVGGLLRFSQASI